MKKLKIEFKNISMKFGNFYANKNISFSIQKNEVHGLLGENGAGKSTLMSILFGLYNQTDGYIKINEKKVKIKNPRNAQKLGIAMLPQHFKLVDNISAFENIILGNEGSFMFINKKICKKIIESKMKKYNIKLDIDKKISQLSTSDKQKVEILKMLWIKNDILIFDEPTSILTPQEIIEFLKMIKNLKKSGKTILLISHKIHEIKQIADRCSILRKGKFIKTVSSKTSINKLVELMIGKTVNLDLSLIKRKKLKQNLLLKLDNINLRMQGLQILKNINFKIYSGEIVGIAAIDGNGQTELFEIISGLNLKFKGNVYLIEKDVSKNKIKNRYFFQSKILDNSDKNKKLSKYISFLKNKEKFQNENILGFIPEDRHKHALFLDIHPSLNAIIQTIDRYKRKFINTINKRKIDNHFSVLKEKYDIRGVLSKKTLTRDLSGGNQQKLIVARELSRNPKVILAMHPTRGLDIGAVRNIYKNLIDKRNKGAGVLFFSGELDEILQVSDRILVLYQGILVKIFNKKPFIKKEVGSFMLGNTNV